MNNENMNNLNNEGNNWINPPINPQDNNNENVSSMPSVNDIINQPKMDMEDLMKPQSEANAVPVESTSVNVAPVQPAMPTKNVVEPQVVPATPVESAPVNAAPVQPVMPTKNVVEPQVVPVAPVESAPVNAASVQPVMPTNNVVEPQVTPVAPVESVPVNAAPVQPAMPTNNVQPQVTPVVPVGGVPVNGTPINPAMPTNAPIQPNNGGKKSKGMLIAIIAIVAVLIVGGIVAAIFLLGDDKDKDKDKPKDNVNEYEEEQTEEVIPTLTIDDVGYDYITVEIEADVEDYNTLCEIHKSTDGKDFDYVMSIQCNGSFTDSNVEEETTYYYKSKVEDSKKYSEVVSATTTANDDYYDDSNNEYSDTITFSGYEFEKVNGYSYTVEDDTLYIVGTEIEAAINILPYSYEAVKTPEMLQYLETSFESSGYLVENMGTRSGDEGEYVAAELTYMGVGMIYTLVDAGNGYVFQGIVANSTGTINYNNLFELFNIIDSAEYVGGYSDYTTDFNVGLDI